MVWYYIILVAFALAIGIVRIKLFQNATGKPPVVVSVKEKIYSFPAGVKIFYVVMIAILIIVLLVLNEAIPPGEGMNTTAIVLIFLIYILVSSIDYFFARLVLIKEPDKTKLHFYSLFSGKRIIEKEDITGHDIKASQDIIIYTKDSRNIRFRYGWTGREDFLSELGWDKK
jgi:hypothetical protein